MTWQIWYRKQSFSWQLTDYRPSEWERENPSKNLWTIKTRVWWVDYSGNKAVRDPSLACDEPLVPADSRLDLADTQFIDHKNGCYQTLQDFIPN